MSADDQAGADDRDQYLSDKYEFWRAVVHTVCITTVIIVIMVLIYLEGQ